MPGLVQSLKNQDLGYLRIVAELWGVELQATEEKEAARQLAAALLDPQLVSEVVEALPGRARAALDGLARSGGRMPWAQFARRYGEVREMGPGRRDRERPYLDPASSAEALWYRALVGRAFFDAPGGPQEFAYLPDDLLALLPAPSPPESAALGRPASPAECAFPLPAADRILDEACTLLAGLRLELAPQEMAASWCWPAGGGYPLTPDSLRALLAEAGLLDAGGLPRAGPTRAFLEASRGEALAQLARAWLESAKFDELALLPRLRLEGEWERQPLRARQAILGFLAGVPEHTWWSLNAFVEAIREDFPDFQRPAGDYDSWYIRDPETGEYQRGFAHWDEVEGELVRFLVTGPLHWLGIADLAAPAAGEPASAFRRSAWSPALLQGLAPAGLASEGERLQVRSDASLSLPRLAPRSLRYQLARFCAWEGFAGEVYRYRLTPASLERARRQGLRAEHLVALLRRSAAPLPPTLLKAVERWEERGEEARLERLLVLRLSSPELLQALRASPAARFLGDPLGPAAVIVRPGAWEKVRDALAAMGCLAEARLEE